MEKIAVIAVNFENYKVTEEFIEGFDTQTSDKFHIFIADHSKNRKSFANRKYVTILPGPNKGFAAGVNLCLKRARMEGFVNFMIIGNDTEVADNLIEAALTSLKNNASSLIGGKIYYYPGFEFHGNRYSKSELGKVLWFAGGTVDWKHAQVRHRGVDEVDTGKYDTFQKTDFVTGCLMCFDISVLNKVGYWDESYFLYYEDADFSERARRRGIKLCYDPSLVIWHKNAQSADGSGSALQKKYQEKGRLRFGFKYAPLRTNLHLLKNFLFKRD